MRLYVPLLLLVLAVSAASAAEAPNKQQIESRLEVIKAQREKLFSDYRMGQMMMEVSLLKDGPLKTEEDKLKAQLQGLEAKQ